MYKTEIMNDSAIYRVITRMAHEIIEKNKGIDDLVLIGIKRRGVPFAKMIAEKIKDVEGKKIPVGVIDITLYRDDLSILAENPIVNGTDIHFPINNKKVIIVDDVMYTGRTIHAAINEVMHAGRPKNIQLAILIDRGHKELPISPDYVGKYVPTSKNEIINVSFVDTDGVNFITIGDMEKVKSH